MTPTIFFINKDGTTTQHVPDIPDGAKADHYNVTETERIGATMMREGDYAGMAVIYDSVSYFRYFRWFVRKFGLSCTYERTDFDGPALMVEADEKTLDVLEEAGFEPVASVPGAKTFRLSLD